MSRFTITYNKGNDTNQQHVEAVNVSANITSMESAGWVLENVERVEDQPIVRYGSEGQRVEYDDEDDASEHLLRMAEGWC